MRARFLSVSFLAAIACGGSDEAQPAAPIVVEDVGFETPESVLHDPVADVYLVSNIAGGPLARDDNGFIARVSPAGVVITLRWIDGASEALTLHAPKGMAIKGDTLFVTDIDVVRAFHRVSGEPLGERSVTGATFLNDLAVGPDGTLYASDTGLRAGAEGFEDAGTDAVYRFRNGQAEAVASGPDLGRPNGLAVSADGITVVTFGSGAVYRLDPVTGARSDLPIPDQGQLDGVVALADGSLVISSWQAEGVYRLGADGTYAMAADSLPAPADIGLDAGRARMLVPLFTLNKVVIKGL